MQVVFLSFCIFIPGKEKERGKRILQSVICSSDPHSRTKEREEVEGEKKEKESRVSPLLLYSPVVAFRRVKWLFENVKLFVLKI